LSRGVDLVYFRFAGGDDLANTGDWIVTALDPPLRRSVTLTGVIGSRGNAAEQVIS
jgi:hypothetical protein